MYRLLRGCRRGFTTHRGSHGYRGDRGARTALWPGPHRDPGRHDRLLRDVRLDCECAAPSTRCIDGRTHERSAVVDASDTRVVGAASSSAEQLDQLSTMRRPAVSAGMGGWVRRRRARRQGPWSRARSDRAATESCPWRERTQPPMGDSAEDDSTEGGAEWCVRGLWNIAPRA